VPKRAGLLAEVVAAGAHSVSDPSAANWISLDLAIGVVRLLPRRAGRNGCGDDPVLLPRPAARMRAERRFLRPRAHQVGGGRPHRLPSTTYVTVGGARRSDQPLGG
jgi:hypothetical protein